ncbi:MAG: hypothetical protein NVSMB56_18580 [Pyrinomonadaceae bacterium]
MYFNLLQVEKRGQGLAKGFIAGSSIVAYYKTESFIVQFTESRNEGIKIYIL